MYLDVCYINESIHLTLTPVSRSNTHSYIYTCKYIYPYICIPYIYTRNNSYDIWGDGGGGNEGGEAGEEEEREGMAFDPNAVLGTDGTYVCVYVCMCEFIYIYVCVR